MASASSDRLLGSVVEEIVQRAKTDLRRALRRREGTRDTGWMLLDFGDVVVHVITEETRSYYDLERLWSDAPRLPFTDAAVPADSAS